MVLSVFSCREKTGGKEKCVNGEVYFREHSNDIWHHDVTKSKCLPKGGVNDEQKESDQKESDQK